jgi:hypothetical protein
MAAYTQYLRYAEAPSLRRVVPASISRIAALPILPQTISLKAAFRGQTDTFGLGRLPNDICDREFLAL